MPGFRGHIAGAIALYGLVIAALVVWCAVTLTYWRALEWLICMLVGALFPDVDTKSKGQQILVLGIIGVGSWWVYWHMWQRVVLLGAALLLTLVVPHRTLFHSFKFILIATVMVVLYGAYCYPTKAPMLISDGGFFILGVASHLVLDRGLRGLRT